MEHIRNTTFDLTSTINSGIDTMVGRFTEFGQNLLTDSKNISDRIDELFKNLANDIFNTFMKVIMQGLMSQLFTGIGALFPGHAKGGIANGWSIVGEKGPELVNFSSPGRVYTAEQTRNALSGGNGVNIKIDLHNESGTQVEAQTTGSTFDGENYVVGVWLKAVSTNKNGIRNIIKGVATV